MISGHYPIPARLNLTLALVLVTALTGLFYLSAFAQGWWLLALSLSYGLLMNTGYALLHEAEHGILHPDRRVNEGTGMLLALFFPAPFHLIRQGHLGHHMRNRSDDEAFDFYFEGESRLWRFLMLYGILTGLFWVLILCSNLLAAVWPGFLRPRKFSIDRPSEALLESLNPRFLRLIWLEAVAAILLHGTMIMMWGIPFWHWLAVLSGFGIMWSAMQYVHHFGTERDVLNGARNLRTWRWLDALWLYHNWHQRHHQQPTVPWVHLPALEGGPVQPRAHMIPAWLRMWRGPSLTRQRVANRFSGRLIR